MAIKEISEFRRKAEAGDAMIPLAFGKRNRRSLGSAQLRCRCDQYIEHFLQVKSGAANDLENVGRSCLLPQRLPQFAEQPHVLDGDDGLGSEICKQLDLLVSKRKHFAAVDCNYPDDFVILEHRYYLKHSATTETDERDVGLFQSKVGDLNCSPGPHKTAQRGNLVGIKQRISFVKFSVWGRCIMESDAAQKAILVQHQVTE